MKLFVTTIVLASALAATSAQAAEPKLTDTTCAQLRDKYELTEEGKARFAQLQGSCKGVYEVNGARYVLVEAVYRGKKDGKTLLYLPATDRTIEVTPKPEMRVLVDGRKVSPSSLQRGDKIEIYLSVDKFAQERVVEEITFPTEDAVAPAPVVEAPAAALPTTASPLPLVATLSLFLLALGGLARRSKGKA
jgi:hypothetical protein